MNDRKRSRTSSGPYKKGPAAIRRMRRRRIRNTMLLLMSFVILVLAGIAGIYLIKDGTLGNLQKPFSILEEFPGTSGQSGLTLADGFAKDLCVSENADVSCEGITLPPEQKGALLDVEGQQVLYAQGLFDKVYPASITKIMTAILACKYGNMEDVVTISEEALNLEPGSQVCGFYVGDTLSMDQLLHCLLVYSGNDAAAAIAEHVAGSTAAFVDMMNEEASRLGCTGTHFTNPHGLQDENHYTTPYDIYLMLQEALHYKEFVEIVQMSSYTVTPKHEDGTTGSITLEATDHYLTGEAVAPKDVTILGGKTGTTSIAGNCLALLSQNAYGKPYVSIVMGASTKDLLYQQMNTLLEKINS
ncbi:MAG: D-alanyl-D-alanine carboxypeptidase family protein [Blautia sp.]|jgi:D-alanyl-D-alanine carboxypeptidase